jgi:hypothetical protein
VRTRETAQEQDNPEPVGTSKAGIEPAYLLASSNDKNLEDMNKLYLRKEESVEVSKNESQYGGWGEKLHSIRSKKAAEDPRAEPILINRICACIN